MLRVSKAAKQGFRKAFGVRYARPTLGNQMSDYKALSRDWETVGNGIREAQKSYRQATVAVG